MVKAKNEENRKAAEDKLVSLIRNGNAIPSYTYVTPADTSQKELVEKLIKDGFDPKLSEREIMESRGILRIFNSGNLRYVWKSIEALAPKL